MDFVRFFIRAEQRADVFTNGTTLGVNFLVVWIKDHGGHETGVRRLEIVPAEPPSLHGAEDATVLADNLKRFEVVLLDKIVDVDPFARLPIEACPCRRFNAVVLENTFQHLIGNVEGPGMWFV